MFQWIENKIRGSSIEVKIISPEGQLWKVEVSSDMKIEKFKVKILAHFYNPKDPTELEPLYKLVLVSKNRLISENKTVKEEKIEMDDELILVVKNKRRKYLEEYSGPNLDEIRTATADKEIKNATVSSPVQHCSESYNAIVRRILFTFAEISSQLLSSRPDVMEILDSINSNLEVKNTNVLNQADVAFFIEMGFPVSKVKLALSLKRNPSLALEWLLDSEDVEEGDEEDEAAGTARASTSNKGIFLLSIKAIMRTLKANRRKEFIPNKGTLAFLVDMGFSRATSIEALRLTGNDYSAACDWLLGERTTSEVDTDEFVNKDSVIFQIYMNNATILAGLADPKTLLAFLSVLENRDNISTWMSDSDTSPVFGEIIKVYQIERHRGVGFLLDPATKSDSTDQE